jgi:hypothetical protein
LLLHYQPAAPKGSCRKAIAAGKKGRLRGVFLCSRGDFLWSAVSFMVLIVLLFLMGEEMDAAKFSAGLRVLAVDDDRINLVVLKRVLKLCNYNNGECLFPPIPL